MICFLSLCNFSSDILKVFKPKYDLWRTYLSLGPNTVTYISFILCVGATNQMKIVVFKVEIQTNNELLKNKCNTEAGILL